jgi:DNA polymerase elongation subunit (family B)
MKILVVDIETSPNLVWAWNNMLWTSPIPYNYIVEESRMLCWAAKWVGQKTTYFRSESNDDFLEKLWSLVDAADAVVHFNGTRFDMKYIRSAFLEEGMDPPHFPTNIDLYQIWKRLFQSPSNKLDFIAEKILGEKKLSHSGAGLWFAYMEGERWAKTKMREYNIQDVALTEKFYEHIKGWIPNHPNHGLYVEDQENPICRNCGSDDVKLNGDEYDATGLFAYKRLKCNNCGANLRGRDAIKGKRNESLQVVK